MGIFVNKFIKITYASPFSEDLRQWAIWMKEMLGHQVNEVALKTRKQESKKKTKQNKTYHKSALNYIWEAN